jgi:flagellum-specific ATP synthase
VIELQKYFSAVDKAPLVKDLGKVTEVKGLIIKGFIPEVSIGSVCEVFPLQESQGSLCEVVGFEGPQALLMPLKSLHGVGHGSLIVLKEKSASLSLGDDLLGRVLDGMGQPIDRKGALIASRESAIYSEAVNPLDRPPIDQVMSLGVRSIDGFNTLGRGQRVGIMAGSGVGKSVLLGMMAKNSDADVNVIAMIGERGREVREFIEHTLGPEGLKKSVVVVATSDQNALMRTRAAFVAATIAEYFSGRGKDVLLFMDSVTRFAMAQREIGLSVGEPPTAKGYTPSVFSLLPKLFERAGRFDGRGSITGLYTVLVEGDDMNDPIGDAVRSIVDGHIVLTRGLAQKGHFPAVDVLQSASRVMRQVAGSDQVKLASFLKELLALYKDSEDLINIGAYKSGQNRKLDMAIQLKDHIDHFLRQDLDEAQTFEETQGLMAGLIG